MITVADRIVMDGNLLLIAKNLGRLRIVLLRKKSNGKDFCAVPRFIHDNSQNPQPTTGMASVSTDRHEGQLYKDKRPQGPAEPSEDSIGELVDGFKVQRDCLVRKEKARRRGRTRRKRPRQDKFLTKGKPRSIKGIVCLLFSKLYMVHGSIASATNKFKPYGISVDTCSSYNLVRRDFLLRTGVPSRFSELLYHDWQRQTRILSC